MNLGTNLLGRYDCETGSRQIKSIQIMDFTGTQTSLHTHTHTHVFTNFYNLVFFLSFSQEFVPLKPGGRGVPLCECHILSHLFLSTCVSSQVFPRVYTVKHVAAAPHSWAAAEKRTAESLTRPFNEDVQRLLVAKSPLSLFFYQPFPWWSHSILASLATHLAWLRLNTARSAFWRPSRISWGYN